MANEEHLKILKQGVYVWNQWRLENPKINIDFSNANLSSTNLSSTNLSSTNLSNANLSNAILSNANLTETILDNANLSGADLSWEKFYKLNSIRPDSVEKGLGESAVWRNLVWGAHFKEVDFFKEARYREAKLQGAEHNKEAEHRVEEIQKTGSRGANLFRATLLKADLRGANLKGTDFREADLTGATLIEAKLNGADFTRAKLIGADLGGVNLSETEFGGTKFIDGIDFEVCLVGIATLADFSVRGNSGQYLSEQDHSKTAHKRAYRKVTDLSGANLSGANLKGVNLCRIYLSGANLCGANLFKTNLSKANLSKANVSRANLQEAELKEACLSEIDLRGRDLTGKNLSAVDFQNAHLETARLFNANLDGANLTGAYLWETQRAGWSIKGIICQYVYWDKEAKEKTEYAPGEFERLFAEQTKIRLFYKDGITPLEIATLPALIQHLSDSHPGCNLRFVSIHEDSGGAVVELAIEEMDNLPTEQVKQLQSTLTTKAQQLVEARRLALTERETRLQLEGEVKQLNNMVDKLLDRTGINIENKGNLNVTKRKGDTYNISGQAGAVGRKALAKRNTLKSTPVKKTQRKS